MSKPYDMLKHLKNTPQAFKPDQQVQNQQFQVDLNNATKQKCICGCEVFQPALNIYTVSALVSPNGQELIAQQAILVCIKCQTPYGAKKGE